MLPRKVRFAVWAACIAAAPQSFAQHLPVPGSLLARTTWCRLDIVGGRVRVVEPRLGHKATVTAESPDGHAVEILAFCAIDLDSACVQYEYLDDQQQWAVDIQVSRQVLIQRSPRNEAGIARVQYRQPEHGAVSLEIEQDGRTLRFAADDFWRLFLAEPDVCGRHLIPILEAMRPDWQVGLLGQRVERALLTKAAEGSMPERQKVDDLIRQLDDREFQRRQAADRQLRALGQQLISHLRRLDIDRLSAEQRIRLQRIARRLEVSDSDSPQRVATWLIDDPAIWIGLLQREDQHVRLAAARHLQTILDRPLDFDALAGATERERQLARLQAEYRVARPVLVGDTSPGGVRR